MQITPPPMPKSQYGLFYEVPPSEFDDEGYQEFIDEPGYTSAQLTTRDQQWLAIVKEAVLAEREACAAECAGIYAGHAAEARRLEGREATHAAGQRDGANECAAAIRSRSTT
jgi:hypothetical protein